MQGGEDPAGHFLWPCVMVRGRSAEEAPTHPLKKEAAESGYMSTAPHSVAEFGERTTVSESKLQCLGRQQELCS